MNPIYRGQYPPINTDVLWIKDDKIYIYQNDGWEAASGSNDNPADEFLSEESENLIENRAVYNQYMIKEDVTDVCTIIDPDYERKIAKKEPLTFEILTDGNINWAVNNSDSSMIRTIQIQVNDGNWETITSHLDGEELSNIPVNAGDIVKIKATNSTYGSASSWSSFTGTTCKLNVSGNIMSLINEENFENLEQFEEGATNIFSHLFYECPVVYANNLILPNETAISCYLSMFASEEQYTADPNNSELILGPSLPATNLSLYCYQDMFKQCQKLQEAPELPALTLANYCYSGMFSGCFSLTQAPELPSTELSDYCYQYMFVNCMSLVQPPTVLPATVLKYACYQQMFFNCPFTSAPSISATTLAYYCCDRMFQNCRNLEVGPDLLATAFPSTNRHCYDGMFNSCSSLRQLKCLVTPSSGNTGYWMVSVSSTGTFIKSSSATWSTGTSAIPEGWTITNA